ncbi:hypothetical protein K469DRAFT_78997 [Zopfia rhizophila CBS 207.26]|uniref:Uncharacterized protein n=1 Tax=Zopfia rhizophila CBS 207.26 TaxID=1314779 RepID=A0A6A6D723_9PEZI|nr:hypothetical protein K469DRAFT_78997 [Zopfia rhizophila CBS 207.26]
MVSNTDIDSWVRAEYRRRYCNADGIRFKAFKAEIFRKSLNSVRPGSDKAIQAAVDRLDNELYKLPHQRLDELVAWVTKECSQKLVDKQGLFCKKAILIDSLARKRPEYHPRRIRQVVNTVEKSNIARATNARKVNGATSKAMPVEANSALRKSNNSGPVNSTSANDSSKITQASQPKLGQASIKQVSHKRPVTTPKPTLGSVDLGAKKPSTKNSNGHAQFKIHPLENFQFQLELGNIPQLNDTKRLIPESTQNEALSQKPKQWDLSSFAQQDPLLSESSNQATSSLKELFPGPFPTPFPLSAPNNPKIAPTSIKDDLLSRNLKQLSLSNATRSQVRSGMIMELIQRLINI